MAAKASSPQLQPPNKEDNPTYTPFVSVAEAMNPQRRSTMEDRHVVLPSGTWGAPDDSMSMFAIYDGHGGRDMVDFLEHGMTHHLRRELAELDNHVPLQTCLERAFLMTDIHARQVGIMSSGSTAVLCLVKPDMVRNQVIITAANVGDARAVLGTESGLAFRLTYDHTAKDANEMARVEQTGGFFFKNRVLGVLMITRSMGDQLLKQYVSAQPHVQQVYAPKTNWNEQSRSSFIIIACDGLWDVMSDRQAVELVNKYSGDKEGVAQFLVDEGLKRGTTDNVTVIVAYL